MSGKIFRLIALWLAAFLPLAMTAQPIRVTGRVLGKDDRNDSRALAGASIMLKDSTPRYTTTDLEGHYSIVVPDTTSMLEFEFIGFQSIEERVGDRTRIDVVMEEDTTEIQVVVIADPPPFLMGAEPVATHSIILEAIKWATPMTLGDVLEQELPGIEFTLVDGQQAGITFQGLEANYLLVLVDGRRLAGETTRSNPDLGRIDIDRVQRIEITRTPSAVRYGSGAVSGVIDIITKQPRKSLEIDLSGRYDTGGEQHYSAGIGSKGDRLSGSVSGVFRDKQAYFLESSGAFSSGHAGAAPTPGEITRQVEIEGFMDYSTAGQLAYEITDDLRASAHAGYYQHERFNAGPVGDRMHDLYRDLNGGIGLDWRLPQDQKLELSYQVDRYTKFNKYLLLDRTERNYRQTLQNPKLLYSNQWLGGHSLIAGAEWLGERLETYQFSSDGQGRGEHRRDNVAAFAETHWRLTGWLKLQAGLRADHDANFGTHLSPGIATMIEIPRSDLRLRAGYAGTFRAPTLKERYTDWDHQGFFQLVGNPNLRPEMSHTFSAGIEYHYSYQSLKLAVNAFHTRIDQKIATVWNAVGDTLHYANASQASVAGVDFSAVSLIGNRWVLRANYAYVHDYQSIDGKNTSSVRPHSATGNIAYRLGKDRGWTINASARWSSSIEQWALDSSSGDYVRLHYPGYTICKLALTGHIGKHIRFTAGVDNLLDYIPKHVTFNAGVTPGRSYFLSLSYAL